MAIALAQSAHGESVSSKAFGGASTAGNLIVVLISVGNTTNQAPSDGTNTYIQANKTASGSGYSVQIYYAYNITAGTYTISTAGSCSELTILEFSGVKSSADPLDQHTGTATASGTSYPTGSVTTTQDNELAVEVFEALTVSSLVAPSGYNNIVIHSGTPGYSTDYKFCTTAGTEGTAYTGASTTSAVAAIATFFAAPITNSKTLSVTQTQTPTVAKSVGKVLAKGQTQTASLTLSRAVTLICSVTQTQTAQLVKSVGKVLGVTGTQTASVSKRVSKTFSVTAVSTPSLVKSVGKSLAVTAQAVASFLGIAVGPPETKYQAVSVAPNYTATTPPLPRYLTESYHMVYSSTLPPLANYTGTSPVPPTSITRSL